MRISIKTDPGWSLLVAKRLYSTGLDGEGCNYIPLNNWNHCPPAVSSSNWMFNIASFYISYISRGPSLAVVPGDISNVSRPTQEALTAQSTHDDANLVKNVQHSVRMPLCSWLSDSMFSTGPSHASWHHHHDLQGCGSYLWKGEVFWSLCTHKLPLGFMAVQWRSRSCQFIITVV